MTPEVRSFVLDCPVCQVEKGSSQKPAVEYAADDGPLLSLLGFSLRSFPAKRAACCVNVLADVSASCALQFRPLFLYRRQRRSRRIRLQVVHELSKTHSRLSAEADTGVHTNNTLKLVRSQERRMNTRMVRPVYIYVPVNVPAKLPGDIPAQLRIQTCQFKYEM